MVCAHPVDDNADRFMDLLKDELGDDAWREAGFRRDIWYANILHFAADIARPAELIEWVAATQPSTWDTLDRYRRAGAIPLRGRRLRAAHASRGAGQRSHRQVWAIQLRTDGGPTVKDTDVSSDRLDLVPMTLELMEALLRGDRESAQPMVGYRIPADWPQGMESMLRFR